MQNKKLLKDFNRIIISKTKFINKIRFYFPETSKRFNKGNFIILKLFSLKLGILMNFKKVFENIDLI